jgi:hypothetical protein
VLVPYISMSRDNLSTDLWHYGEDVLSRRVLEIDDDTMRAIGRRAGEISFSDTTTNLIALSAALAAVEVLDGGRQTLARKRRQGVSRRPPWVTGDHDVHVNFEPG